MWWWWSNNLPFFAHKESIRLAADTIMSFLRTAHTRQTSTDSPYFTLVVWQASIANFRLTSAFLKKRSKTITCGDYQNLQPSWHQRHAQPWLWQTVNCRWWQLSIKYSHLHHTCCAHGKSTKTSCPNGNDNLRRASNGTCCFSGGIIWWQLTRKWNWKNSGKSYQTLLAVSLKFSNASLIRYLYTRIAL